jgi:hypothetical protein
MIPVITAAASMPLLAGSWQSSWSEAVNLGAPINSPFRETGVTLSRNGLSLFFVSDRPCDEQDEVADFNLWVTRRGSLHVPWGAPQCLRINADARLAGDAPYQDREVDLSRDQHWLYFVSDRPGSLGPPVPAGGDIWVSWRANVFDDQGWEAPIPLVGLNTESREGTPHYFENRGKGLPQLFFTSTRNGFFDIFVADVIDGTVAGQPRPVDEVNSDQLDAGNAVTPDGLEMFLFRGLPGAGISFDIFRATRRGTRARWSAPENLGPLVNSAAVEQEPAISPDRTTLFFASNRPGSTPGPTGAPSLDIWASVQTWSWTKESN